MHSTVTPISGRKILLHVTNLLTKLLNPLILRTLNPETLNPQLTLSKRPLQASVTAPMGDLEPFGVRLSLSPQPLLKP